MSKSKIIMPYDEVTEAIKEIKNSTTIMGIAATTFYAIGLLNAYYSKDKICAMNYYMFIEMMKDFSKEAMNKINKNFGIFPSFSVFWDGVEKYIKSHTE